MHVPDPASIRAAATRLRGHLVQTPLIGALPLPLPAGLDLRLFPDGLQPGGSAWYRGFQHFLLRQFGAGKELVVAVPPARLLAAALAAAGHRLPTYAFVAQPLPAPLAALVAATGCTVTVAHDVPAAAQQRQRQHGGLWLPGAEAQEVAAGLATAGLELAAALPSTALAVHADAEVATALQAGLAAGGAAAVVVPVAATAALAPAAEALRAPLLWGQRLALGDSGLRALLAASRHPEPGVVAAYAAE